MTEEQILEEKKKLAEKIAKEKENSYPLGVCLEGSNKAFFNTK